MESQDAVLVLSAQLIKPKARDILVTSILGMPADGTPEGVVVIEDNTGTTVPAAISCGGGGIGSHGVTREP